MSILFPLQLLRWTLMKIATLLLKVMAKSVSPYALMDSSLFLCGLLLKSAMGQLLVGCASHNAYNIICKWLISACLHKHYIVWIVHSLTLKWKRGWNSKCYPHSKLLLICFIITEEGPNGAEMLECQSKEPYHMNYACLNFAFTYTKVW